MNAEQLFRVRLSSNRTSRLYLPRRAQLEIEQITGAARQENGEVWRWKADGRPAVYGCALPLRLQKEWPFFPTFGDEERESFFQGDPDLALKTRSLIIFGEKKKASKLKFGKNYIL